MLTKALTLKHTCHMSDGNHLKMKSFIVKSPFSVMYSDHLVVIVSVHIDKKMAKRFFNYNQFVAFSPDSYRILFSGISLKHWPSQWIIQFCTFFLAQANKNTKFFLVLCNKSLWDVSGDHKRVINCAEIREENNKIHQLCIFVQMNLQNVRKRKRIIDSRGFDRLILVNWSNEYYGDGLKSINHN